jgi:putative addiction module killer protein
MESGLMGDIKSVGGKVAEARIDVGQGYRLYYTKRGLEIILLLCGGMKSSQSADIARAQKMVADLDVQAKAAAAAAKKAAGKHAKKK